MTHLGQKVECIHWENRHRDEVPVADHQPDYAQASDTVDAANLVRVFPQTKQLPAVGVERECNQQTVALSIEPPHNKIVSRAHYHECCNDANEDTKLNDKISVELESQSVLT